MQYESSFQSSVAHDPYMYDTGHDNNADMVESLKGESLEFGTTAKKLRHQEEEEEEEEEAARAVEDDIEFLLSSVEHDKELSKAPCPELTESLVAKEMANLSVQDREEVYFDIHGVSRAVEEDVTFLDGKLDEMQCELEKIDVGKKKAYLMALTANPEYVKCRNLRLRFLRASRFDAEPAAQRYVYHFQVKLDLFGAEKLGRNIIQEDFDKEGLEALYNGYNQPLPQRDSAGRPVFVYVSNNTQRSYSHRSLLQRFFYNSMMMADDVETQKKGLVSVIYAVSNLKRRDDEDRSRVSGSNLDGDFERITVGNSWKLIGTVCRAAPVKLIALHFCYSELAWLPVVSTVRLAADIFSRLRFRAHRGSHNECMYLLQTFGIPTAVFPVNENGDVISDKFRMTLEKRRVQENLDKNQRDKNTSSDDNAGGTKAFTEIRVAVPNARDVLLGRGKGFFNHVGNVRYRGIIEDLKEEYNASLRTGKKQITHDVVQMIHQSGGRFLKEHGAGWISVDEEVARLKVSHSFRAAQSPPASRTKTPAGKLKSSTTPDGVAATAKNDDHPRMKRTRAS